jgi:hypothetical protein
MGHRRGSRPADSRCSHSGDGFDQYNGHHRHMDDAAALPTLLCGPRVLARLHALRSQPVDVVTLRARYSGRLMAVHPRAVWLELRDDCMVAITEPIVTVAPRPAAPIDASSASGAVGEEAVTHAGLGDEVLGA